MERCSAGTRFDRRGVIQARFVLVVAGVAGCTGDGTGETGGTTASPGPDASGRTSTATEDEATGAGGSNGDDRGPDASTTANDDECATTTDGGSGADEGPDADDELDRREANVVGVEVELRGGSYRFAVTLYHDDDGEDGYVDW